MIYFHVAFAILIIGLFTRYHILVNRGVITDELSPAEDTTITMYRYSA